MKFIVFYLQFINSLEGLGMFFSNPQVSQVYCDSFYELLYKLLDFGMAPVAVTWPPEFFSEEFYH